MRDAGVLVLNSLFQAVQITAVRRAFHLFYAGRARALTDDFQTYTFERWCELPTSRGYETIRTPTLSIRIPHTIQLVRYDRLPRREVRFSRRNVFYRDRNRCQYCRHVFPQRELNIDHVVPLSRAGRSRWDNVVTACIPCNSRKGDRTPAEAGMALLRAPRRPAGHPVLRASWLRHFRDEWRSFLDEAYWNVELSEECMPARDG